MKGRYSNSVSISQGTDVQTCLPSGSGIYLILAAVIFLSYGYELFNFNLSIDEELHANRIGSWLQWVVQGRWGMAFLNYLIVPNPIVPATSLFLGIIGLVYGNLFLLNSLFNLDKLGLIALTALASTIPTIAFSLTFSTLAYGIGVGFLAVAGANWLLARGGWKHVVMASLLASFAIGVYQTFVFVIAMIAIVRVWHGITIEKNDIFTSLIKPTLFVISGCLLYGIINLIVLKCLRVDIQYVGQFIDIHGFIQNPLTRISKSFHRCVEIISLSPNEFGIRSIWLGVLVLVSFSMVVVSPILKRDYRSLLWTITIHLSITFVALIADVIAQGKAPLRSAIYLPFGISIIVACAYIQSGKIAKYALVTLCGLTVIGNSQISNHLFASSASAEFQDRMLAVSIIDEIRHMKTGNANNLPLKIEVIGNHAWPTNGILSKSETFGASFFEWGAGNRYRVAAYLRLNGLASIGATDKDRALVYKQGEAMPAWPNAGWMTVSGDILILKFGDYSALQRKSLCTQRVTELCENP